MSKFLQFTDAESGKDVCIPKDMVHGFSGHKAGATKIRMFFHGGTIPNPDGVMMAMESVDEIHARMRG